MTSKLFLAGFVVSILVGCSGPPQSLSLDYRFNAYEVAVFQDARDQWCEKTGWCPDFVTDGEAHIQRKSGMGDVTEGSTGVGGHTDGIWNLFYQNAVVSINGDLLDSWPEIAFAVISHELGHISGREHHGMHGCTMFSNQDEPNFEITCE